MKNETIKELREKREITETELEDCYENLDMMINRHYSVDEFVTLSARIRAAQWRLRALKTRLHRLETGNAGPELPMYTPVSMYNLQNKIEL